MELSSAPPFMDPFFLQENPIIDEKNWFEYFKKHHEFDQNCLNIQRNLRGTLLREEDFIREGIQGIVYLFKRIDSKMFLIKKVDIYSEDWSVLKVYVVVEQMIFSGVNLKALLSMKIANIGYHMNGIVNSLVDKEDFSDDEPND